MAWVLHFTANWNKWYRVLRYRKGFGPYGSVRFGFWLLAAEGGGSTCRPWTRFSVVKYALAAFRYLITGIVALVFALLLVLLTAEFGAAIDAALE